MVPQVKSASDPSPLPNLPAIVRAGAGLVVGALALAGGMNGCAAFSGEDGASSDGGGVDGGGVGVDGASGGPTAFVTEKAATQFVASDTGNIYWWSTKKGCIERVGKKNLAQTFDVVCRMGVTVGGVAVDSTNVYWLESGAGDGGVTSRIQRVPSSGINAVPALNDETTTILSQILLAGSVSASAGSGNGGPSVVLVSTDGSSAKQFDVGITAPLIAGDGSKFYYYFLDSIFSMDQGGGTQKVASGLSGSGQIVADTSNLYVADLRSGANVLITFAKDGPVTDAKAVSGLATLASGALLLAMDRLGVVVADVREGSISRVDRITGAITNVASMLGSINQVAADPDGIYYSTEDGDVGWLPSPQ